jgi:hypothetical protein
MKKESNFRDDVAPMGLAPKSLRNAICKAAGFNPYGEPRYRLALAQHVYALRGGEHLTWDDNLTVEEQGGLVQGGTIQKCHMLNHPSMAGARSKMVWAESPVLVPSTKKPTRTFVGVEKVMRYPTIEGWILQMWRPASHFGTPEYWNSSMFLWKGDANNNVNGPYPERGDYEFASERVERSREGPMIVQLSWPEIPALSLLEDMIQFLDSENMKQYGADKEARRAIRMNETAARWRHLEEKKSEMRQQMIRDTMAPYLGSSLAAGAMRTKLAERAGLRGHVGN